MNNIKDEYGELLNELNKAQIELNRINEQYSELYEAVSPWINRLREVDSLPDNKHEYETVLSDHDSDKFFFGNDDRMYKDCLSFTADEAYNFIHKRFNEIIVDYRDVIYVWELSLVREDIFRILKKELLSDKKVYIVRDPRISDEMIKDTLLNAADDEIWEVITPDSLGELRNEYNSSSISAVYLCRGENAGKNEPYFRYYPIPSVREMKEWLPVADYRNADIKAYIDCIMYFYYSKYALNSPFALNREFRLKKSNEKNEISFINAVKCLSDLSASVSLSYVLEERYSGTLGDYFFERFHKEISPQYYCIQIELPNNKREVMDFYKEMFSDEGSVIRTYSSYENKVAGELRAWIGKSGLDIEMSEELEHALTRRIEFIYSMLDSGGVGDEYIDYDTWYHEIGPKPGELYRQRKTEFRYMPKFSLVIPVYKTTEVFLRMLIDSILEQTYISFEVCFVDASEYTSNKALPGEPRTVIEEYAQKDKRIRYKILDKNRGISNNTNAAIDMAEGDYIVFVDHDDEITPNALYECAKVINENPWVCVIYSDEDKVDKESTEYSSPHFKPDYNRGLLTSNNYISHLFVVRNDILESISNSDKEGRVYERSEFEGAQDYDLIIRCCERAEEIEKNWIKRITQNLYESEMEKKFGEKYKKSLTEGRYTSLMILHISKVLYHWRVYNLSTYSGKDDIITYTVEAGRKVLIEWCKRSKISIKGVENSGIKNVYHIKYKNSNPQVSVIIPNKDHINDLDKVITSISDGEYDNLEFIIVENNSEDSKTFSYYEDIVKKYSNVKVVYYNDGFNYSRICNYGVKYARGEVLLFQNNDTEMLSKNSISEMVGMLEQEAVGVVGAKLMYDDDTIQHAGIVVGLGGVAENSFRGCDAGNTYQNYGEYVRDCSSVTGASMMIRRDDFIKAGGFTEELAVAFSDVDLCLKIHRMGKRIVYDPYAVFYHYESKSRGSDQEPDKIERFRSEIVLFGKRWADFLKQGDPHYNPNLTMLRPDYSLKALGLESIGKPCYNELLVGIVTDE